MGGRDRCGERSRERQRKHKRRYESDYNECDHGVDYRTLYRELREEMRRKRRDLFDYENRLVATQKRTKRAREETENLWKVYYQLQNELEQSYGVHSRMAKENEQLQKEYERLKSEYEELRTEYADPGAMKTRLIEMQKEKLGMQESFNDMVIINKMLREIETHFEPRLLALERALSIDNSAVVLPFQKALEIVVEQRAGVLDELHAVLQTVQLLTKEVKSWSESFAEQLKSAKVETLRQLNCIRDAVNVLRESCGLEASTLHATETTTRKPLPSATSDDLRDALRTSSTVIDTLLMAGLEEVGTNALIHTLQEALGLLLHYLMQSTTENAADKYDALEP